MTSGDHIAHANQCLSNNYNKIITTDGLEPSVIRRCSVCSDDNVYLRVVAQQATSRWETFDNTWDSLCIPGLHQTFH